MKFIVFILIICLTLVACNPFAPALDNSKDEGSNLLSDQKTPDGVCQNLKYAYTFRDTTVYGHLIDGNFTFIYPDYDNNNGADVTWGRYIEMQSAYALFQYAQRLDLIWNRITDSSFNADRTVATISRGFNLTVTLNPNQIIYVDGYADLTLGRQRPQDPWMITSWYDDSNH